MEAACQVAESTGIAAHHAVNFYPSQRISPAPLASHSLRRRLPRLFPTTKFQDFFRARENRGLPGFAVASVRVRKLTPPVDNAEHLAKIFELLDWLKRAKAQELRDKQRAAKGP